ncbi:hypothetical protein Tco_1514216, partial [Tanacetum coccineum]
DTSAENPVKEILLKLNLPDHRILKDGHGDAIAESLPGIHEKERHVAKMDLND